MSSNATEGAQPPAVLAGVPPAAVGAQEAPAGPARGEAGSSEAGPAQAEATGEPGAGSGTIVLDPEPGSDPAETAETAKIAETAAAADPGEPDEPGESGEPDRPESLLAFVALLTSLFALVPIAVGCAAAALISIRRSGRRGHGMAMAALFVSAAWVILVGAVATVGVLTHGFHKPVKVTYHEAAVFRLQAGDCVNIPNGQVVSILPCSTPHEAEVFATFSLPVSAWPGTAAVQQEASSGCVSRLTGYINPQLAISLSQDYVFPDQADWTAGTRTVICEVRATSGQLTGSVRGASLLTFGPGQAGRRAGRAGGHAATGTTARSAAPPG